MKLLKLFALFLFMFATTTSWAKMEVGSSMLELKLSGDDGGRLDGKPWSSSELAGKVGVVFYVDPDVKDLNEKFGDLLKEKNYSLDKITYVAIINMKATWLPNFALTSSLKVKQRKYTSTLYLKDFEKKLVAADKFADENYNILIVDPSGKVLFYKEGKMSDEEIKKAIALIEENLPKV